MLVRPETDKDIGAVRAVNSSAFPTSTEADLVDVLRREASPCVSLVAESGKGIVVGHIMFTPVKHSNFGNLKIMGLAPMAVLPDHQRSGIGSALIRAGLDACTAAGVGAVVVLGHPEYYPKFGFKASTAFNIGSEYDVPEDVFMALELKEGYLTGASGRIQFHPAFKDLE